MNTEQIKRSNDSIAALIALLISAYAMHAARLFAQNLCGGRPTPDVARELNDWREAESQLRHAYAIYIAFGKSPVDYLSRPDDHGERENAIRRLVYANLVARMSGRRDEMPNLASLPPLPARTSEKTSESGR